MKTRELSYAALIAAVYAALTVGLAPISFGLIQCRVAEALCVLPFLTGAAVPGLFAGCLLANLLTGAPAPDVLFGSLATLVSALLTYGIRKLGCSKLLAPLPPVLVNAAVVGALLVYVYDVGVGYAAAFLYVFVGQAAACYGLGLPLLALLEKHAKKWLP